MCSLSKLNKPNVDNFLFVKKSKMQENFPQSSDLNRFEKTKQSSLAKLADYSHVPQVYSKVMFTVESRR